MRTKRRRKQPEKRNGMLLRVVKASLLGCILTIIAILFFALLLKIELLNEDSIPIITSVIKALCAAVAGLLAARGSEGRGWLWG
ncbi:MAG TPA: TIGR04086 family membrane protein, partial [Feifaniaceae bacterium]|nr:TIGR04086 family membrane protein [Feifaniaceae bacterium]